MKKHPYTSIATLYAITGAIMLILLTTSCASKCQRMHRYWHNHRVI
jgi:hypothetical protein